MTSSGFTIQHSTLTEVLMECRDAGPMIAAAADEVLDPDRMAQVTAHVASCAACRAALDDQRAVRAVLGSRPAAPAPADFVARVNGRIDEEAGWFGLADFRQWTLRLAPAAIVLAILALVGSANQPADSDSSDSQPTVSGASFSPASADDWQRDVSADALLDAALNGSTGTYGR
jgi:anti-sigma factor RsiW